MLSTQGGHHGTAGSAEGGVSGVERGACGVGAGAATSEDVLGLGSAGTDRVGVCGWEDQHTGCTGVGGQEGNGREVAATVR